MFNLLIVPKSEGNWKHVILHSTGRRYLSRQIWKPTPKTAF